jgi:subtilisin family serine protease
VLDACNLPDGQFFHYKWDCTTPGMAPHAGEQAARRRHRLVGGTGSTFWAATTSPAGPSSASSTPGIRPTHQAFTGKIQGGAPLPERRRRVDELLDDHSHGTHVAGIAAGIGTAAIPGVGYGRNIKLLVGKVCNSAGSCPSSSTADGIVWMADNGANVINMSLGSFGGNPDGTGSAAQQAALRYAASKNVLSVCATGNDDAKSTNGYTGGIGYPARFPECMAVGCHGVERHEGELLELRPADRDLGAGGRR